MEKPVVSKVVKAVNVYYQEKEKADALYMAQCRYIKDVMMPALQSCQISLVHLLEQDPTFFTIFRTKFELGHLSEWASILEMVRSSLVSDILSKKPVNYLAFYMPTLILAIAAQGLKPISWVIVCDFWRKYVHATWSSSSSSTSVTPATMLETMVRAVFAKITSDNLVPSLAFAGQIIDVKGTAALNKVKIAVLTGVTSLFWRTDCAKMIMESDEFSQEVTQILILINKHRNHALTDAQKLLHQELCYLVPSGPVKFQWIKDGILLNGGKKRRAHMKCKNQIYHVVGSMAMKKINHYKKKCTCSCECVDCCDKLCSNYNTDLGEIRLLAEALNISL